MASLSHAPAAPDSARGCRRHCAPGSGYLHREPAVTLLRVGGLGCTGHRIRGRVARNLEAAPPVAREHSGLAGRGKALTRRRDGHHPEEQTNGSERRHHRSGGGRRGGTTTKKRYGPAFYQGIGKKGGETTKQRHGREHYEKIGKMGGQTMKKLIAKAKRMK